MRRMNLIIDLENPKSICCNRLTNVWRTKIYLFLDIYYCQWTDQTIVWDCMALHSKKHRVHTQTRTRTQHETAINKTFFFFAYIFASFDEFFFCLQIANWPPSLALTKGSKTPLQSHELQLIIYVHKTWLNWYASTFRCTKWLWCTL